MRGVSIRPRAVEGERLSPDLLDDEDALNDAVLAFLAAHERGEGSTRQLVAVELDCVRRQLDPDGREVLEHALGLIDLAHEEAAVALATGILRDLGPREPTVRKTYFDDPQRLAAALDQVVRADSKLNELSRRALRLQARIRARVDDATWRRFLRWEEAVNTRAATAQEAIARACYESRRGVGGEGTPAGRDARCPEPRCPGRGGAR